MKHATLALALAVFALPTVQASAAAGWLSRLTPFGASKERQRMRSMDDDELVFSYLSLAKPPDAREVDFVLDSAWEARREVMRRVSRRRFRGAFLEALEPAMRARLLRDLEAAADASGFIDGFLALAKGDASPEAYRGILAGFILDKMEGILALGPSALQLGRMAGAVGGERGPVGILRAALGRAGEASEFLEVFWAVADSGVRRDVLEGFVLENMESLEKLDPSFAQIGRLARHFYGSDPFPALLGLGLKKPGAPGSLWRSLRTSSRSIGIPRNATGFYWTGSSRPAGATSKGSIFPTIKSIVSPIISGAAG